MPINIVFKIFLSLARLQKATTQFVLIRFTPFVLMLQLFQQIVLRNLCSHIYWYADKCILLSFIISKTYIEIKITIILFTHCNSFRLILNVKWYYLAFEDNIAGHGLLLNVDITKWKFKQHDIYQNAYYNFINIQF